MAYAELERFDSPSASDSFYAGIGSATTFSAEQTALQDALFYYDSSGGQSQTYTAGAYSTLAYPTDFATDLVLQILVDFDNATVRFGAGGVFGAALALPLLPSVLVASTSSTAPFPMNARMRTTAARFIHPIPLGATAWDDGSVAVV